MRTPTALPALVAAACLLAGGCAPPKATVTGRVTFQGRPVPWGAVTLVSADGVAHPGALRADGSFTIPGVPVGPVKVAVRSPNPGGATEAAAAPARRGGPAGRPTRLVGDPAPVPKPVPARLDWFPIPDRFADPDQSGLTAEVRVGEPVLIDLR